MNKHYFTDEELEVLRKNPNIAHCSNKSITFTPEFKHAFATAVKAKEKRTEFILKEMNIPIDIIGMSRFRWSAASWKNRSIEDLAIERRGCPGVPKPGSGRKKKSIQDIAAMSDKERIEYYEARCAYLDEENDFFAEARGVKRIPFVYLPGQRTQSSKSSEENTR